MRFQTTNRQKIPTCYFCKDAQRLFLKSGVCWLFGWFTNNTFRAVTYAVQKRVGKRHSSIWLGYMWESSISRKWMLPVETVLWIILDWVCHGNVALEIIITLSGTVQLKEEENNCLTKTKDLTAVPHDAFREKVCGGIFWFVNLY